MGEEGDGGGGPFFSLAELQVPAAGLPDGVDQHNRQNFLSDAEFTELFKMDKAEFAGKPKWKQQQLKKRHGLF